MRPIYLDDIVHYDGRLWLVMDMNGPTVDETVLSLQRVIIDQGRVLPRADQTCEAPARDVQWDGLTLDREAS